MKEEQTEPSIAADADISDAVTDKGIGSFIWRFLTASAFVFLSSMIVVMASERVYWYWAADPNEFCFGILNWWPLAVWYCLPTIAALWALGCAQATKWHQVVLAAAVYAYIAEGIITPVMYEGGLFDLFMPAMFLGWHGIFAMVGFLFLTRFLIVKKQRRMLTVAAIVAGLFWGLWATTSWLPELALDAEAGQEDGWSTTILTSPAFASYAFVVGAMFALCHWLIARVWPADFRPGKWSTGFVIAINTLLFIPMAIVIPWAPLKFGFFTGIALWALHRSRRVNERPTIFARLAGPAAWLDVAPVMLMPAVAAVVYAGLNAVNPSEVIIRTYFYFGLIWVQVIMGAVAFFWALAKSIHPSG